MCVNDKVYTGMCTIMDPVLFAVELVRFVSVALHRAVMRNKISEVNMFVFCVNIKTMDSRLQIRDFLLNTSTFVGVPSSLCIGSS